MLNKSVVISANNRRFAFVLELTGRLKRERCDLLYTHFNPVAVSALTAAKLAGVPLTFSTLHSGFKPQEVGKLGIRCKLPIKTRCYLSNQVFTVSEMVKKQFLMLGLDERKSTIHYLGVSVANCSVSREQMRREMGIKDDELVVVYVALHSPVRGIDILFKVLKIIIAEIPKVEFMQIGGLLFPQETEELRKLNSELGLKDRLYGWGRETMY